jgi:hypothetical protein
MPISRRRAAPFAFVVAFAVAACGGVGTGEVEGETATPDPIVSPDVSPEMSPEASPELSPDVSPEVSPETPDAEVSPDPGATGDLEGMIPTQVGDVALTVTPVDAETYMAVNPTRQIQPLLELSGRSIDDVDVVTATGSTEEASLFIDAVRIAGVDAAGVRTGMTELLAAVPGSEVEATTLGGKDVVRLDVGEDQATVVYPHDDVVFFVQAGTEELLEQALQALP